MIKTELIYNPYLLETEIRFNGQLPRINSLVEKYRNGILQAWVDKIPGIFCDEMNGYGFELEFSGTKLDCEDVRQAFLNAGVDETEVRVFHRNELDGRYHKIGLIETLLTWFKQNPNRKFDYAAFTEENSDFLYNYCNCIVVNGPADEYTVNGYQVAMEAIEDVHELDNTKLFHTPIVLWIDKDTVKKMQQNLRYFAGRKDVNGGQLFFMIQPPLNVESVTRTIRDLGVEIPNVITSVMDEKMKKYLEIYPVTDYIYKAIKLFRSIEFGISERLRIENEQSQIANREIHNRIDELESIIKMLKMSAERFANRDNSELATEMREAKTQLMDSIQNWKNRKTKMTKDSEAAASARELDNSLKRWYQEFNERIVSAVKTAQSVIDAEYREWYQQAEFDGQYVPSGRQINMLEIGLLSEIADDVLTLKEERYVVPKEERFSLFFKASADKTLDPVLEVTYYYQKWREYAATIVEPLAEEIIREYENRLNHYSMTMAEVYQKHLEELIREQTYIKEGVSAQLSDDERKLQMDNDWLTGFQDQLRVIERG